MLVCIIDGISHYETDDFEDNMLKVLECLLGLVKDAKMAAAVKLLAASPTTTDLMQDRFKGDDDLCFLSLASIHQTRQGVSLPLLTGKLDDESEDSEDSETSDENDD
jgi:hypothetical protein